MMCPRCGEEFEGERAKCPECGAELLHMVSGTMKTSAVIVSGDGKPGFYHSVQEVPEPLRGKLLRATSGENAGTIVIADRAGQQHVTRIVEQRAAAAQPKTAKRGFGLSWIAWAGIALFAAAAAVVAAVFTIR